MLQVMNASGLTARLLVVPDIHGLDAALVVVKGAFSLRTGKRLDEHPALITADVWTGEPNHSRLREVSDIAFGKQSTDVLLCGSAYAPGGVAQPEILVSARVGAVRKTMRVMGARTWKKSWWGEYPTAPEPFYVQALDWALDHAAPPVIEDPRQPCKRRQGPRSLWGCGPIPPSWPSRRRYAGTYDAAWQRQRAPFLPVDFDPRFFQVAPPDQQVPGHLQGGEPIELINCTADGLCCAMVPTVKLRARAIVGSVDYDLPLHLGTLAIWPDGELLEMVWHGLLPLGRKILHLKRVHIDE
jgi:hypothetical protein